MTSTGRESTVSSSETATEKKTPRVDLDSILVNELGQFGKFQIWTIFLAGMAALFSVSPSNEYVFSTARISSRCQIPECDLENPEFAPSWLLNAIPGTSLKSFDSCQRYANANVTAAPAPGESICPAKWFDRSQLELCDRHVYNATDTIVYDFNLGCDEWRRSFVGTVVVTGMIVAMPLTGFFSDRWGRRTALVFNTFNTAWIGLLRYFSNSYLTYTLSMFAQSALGGGTNTAAQMLAMEVTGPRYRVAATAIGNSFFTMGLVVLSLLAWLAPNWRILTLMIYAPQVLILSYVWIMPESIRWLYSKGRYNNVEKSLQRVAKINNKKLSEKSLQSLKESVEDYQRNQVKTTNQTEPWLIFLVFKHKRILLRCIVAPIWWIASIMVYYGMLINAVNISGDRYLNYMAVSLVQIPGLWIAFFILDRIGRRPLLCGGFWICAVCQIAYIFIPKDQTSVFLALYLVGTACSAGVISSIYTYTAELFPTQYRHRLFGFCSMMGRLGVITATLTPALSAEIWEELPFALFGGFAGVAGGLVLLMPETRGLPLTNTMEEAENLGKTKLETTSS